MDEDYYSEGRTEPLSQAAIEERLRGGRSIEEDVFVEHDTIPLDSLIVDEQHHQQGIRLLVRPLVRSRSVTPSSENCEWLALRAEVSAPEQAKCKVLAVTQTSKDINFVLRIPGQMDKSETRPPLWCELYYDPASDNQILLNRSDVPILVLRVTHQDQDQEAASSGQEIVPGTTKGLSPGTWRISVYGRPVIDFRILAKRPARLWIPREDSNGSVAGSIPTSSATGKRAFALDDDEEDDVVEKKARTADRSDEEDGVIVFYPHTNVEPLVFPLPQASGRTEVSMPSGHALLQLERNETISILGGCELDTYRLTKRDQIAATSASTVYTAEHSNSPDAVVTVKVLKTRAPNKDHPQDNHRSVIRQADVWLREYRSQEDLQHESIVKLYGGDARYLSLYMEHVDGKDLAARGVWRDAGTELFLGDRHDAIRILRDIAGALNYVHQRRRVHNDIKPANILYSRDRGAVLCDFGLSTHSFDNPTTGGTPYYVPPEYIGHKLRGEASDVWALGITMLYVLQKITFPDARGRQGHPQQLYWMIAEVNRRTKGSSKSPPAVTQMQQWLGEVYAAKAKLDTKDKLHVLVRNMLTPNPAQRITMAKVMTELFRDGALRS